MPNLITTRTRIADQGKPRTTSIGGGFGGLRVTKGSRGFKTQTVLFNKCKHHSFQPLLYQGATSSLETQSTVSTFWKRFSINVDFFHQLVEVRPIKPEENWMFVHLISLIPSRNKSSVLFSWPWSSYSYDKHNRLIIARTEDGVH